jgi:predicted amidohydrolase YtcJ
VASMQPAFDRLWGGAGQMYEQRLGLDRSLASNPIGALAGVGVALAFGSDSPVTPLDPWGTVKAAMNHHNPVHRIGIKTAFAAHTRGGWRAARVENVGTLVPGADATFAVWDVPGGLGEFVDQPPSSGSSRAVRGQRAGAAWGLPALFTTTPDEPDPDLPTCLRTVAHGMDIYERSSSTMEES